jgi:hypothetical protein
MDVDELDPRAPILPGTVVRFEANVSKLLEAAHAQPFTLQCGIVISTTYVADELIVRHRCRVLHSTGVITKWGARYLIPIAR